MRRNNSESKLDVHGWCRRLDRQWALPDVPEERRIDSEVAFSSPIEMHLKDSDGRRRLHTAKVQFRVSTSPAVKPVDSDAGLDTKQFAHHCAEGAVLFVGVGLPARWAAGELIIGLPPTEFDALWAQSTGAIALELKATLRDVGAFNVIELAVDHETRALADLRLRLVQRTSVPSAWIQEPQARDFEQALAGAHLNHSLDSQVSRIIAELAQSAVARDDYSRANCISYVQDLLEDIRPAFRRPLNITGEPYSNGWDLAPAEFEKAVAELSSAEASQLTGRYDTLWGHFSIMRVLNLGEEKAGASTQGLEPDVGKLESAAAKLLALPGMHSLTLEWVLVDALMYTACIDCAQTAALSNTPLGVDAEGKVKGLATWKALSRQFLGGIVKSTAAAVFELVKVGATFFVANILAQDETPTVWVITTGVTAARWVRLGLAAQTKRPQQLQAELLLKMASVYELLKTPSFNAALVRDQLYKVAADGGVFSSWVLNILDARIRRGG